MDWQGEKRDMGDDSGRDGIRTMEKRDHGKEYQIEQRRRLGERTKNKIWRKAGENR